VFPGRGRFFFISKIFRSALGPPILLIQWILGVFFPGVKWLGHGTDPSCPFSAVPIFLLYRVSQEECAKLRESVPYVKIYRYNPNHLYPKLNGYVDNSQRKL
jgi:hypothetical protein